MIGSHQTGAYRVLQIDVPRIALFAQAGQFVALALEDSQLRPLRRFFSIVDAYGSEIEIVISPIATGTHSLAKSPIGSKVNIFGPLGRPFPVPESGNSVCFVGGGHGSAGILRAAREAATIGCDVHMILGSANESRLFGEDRFEKFATSLTVVTEDGSRGKSGRVTEPLRQRIAAGVSAVYACGPMPMLATVSDLAAQADVSCWVSTEVHMACAYGVCMSCVLPVKDDILVTRMSRACVDGPVMRGDTIRWQDIGAIPVDSVGRIND